MYTSEGVSLVIISIAVWRHHDHGNSYKRKQLSRVSYGFRDFGPYHHDQTWWRASRLGAVEGVESSTSSIAGNRK